MSFEDVIKDIENIYDIGVELFTDKTKKHNFIQHRICQLATKYKCVGKQEYQIKNAYRTRKGKIRVGYIDVVWFYKNKIILAVEVDSSYRVKSIAKLLKVSSKYKVWLCYQEKFDLPIIKPKEIYYIMPFAENSKCQRQGSEAPH